MKKIINTIAIIFSFYSMNNQASAQWVTQNSGTTAPLRGVYFTDPDTGYVCDDVGGILKTTDGGTTWNVQFSGTTQGLWGIYFADTNTGYAVGQNGTIIKTTDGGSNWNAQISGTTEALLSVYFINTNTGYAVGLNGTILKTIDGGAIWNALSSGTTSLLLSVHFINSDTGYVGGEDAFLGIILKTINGGNNWVIQTSGMSSTPSSVYFINSDTGYVVGWDNTIFSASILKTTNGGINWLSQYSGIANTELRSVQFTSTNTGYAVGDAGTIVKTTDGGTNWNTHTSGTINSLWAVSSTSDSVVYAIGDNGIILKTTSGGTPFPPVATFAANDTTICKGQTVTFTDQSTWSPTSRLWIFAGGTPSSDISANPTVVYASVGTYDVKLVVSNSDGSDSLTKTNYITVDSNPQTGSIIGPTNVSELATENYSVTLHTGSIYNWSIIGGNQVSGSQSNSVGVQWGIMGLGQLIVIETDSNGCIGDTVSLSVNIGGSSINEIGSGKQAVSIYPNPFNTFTIIKISNEIKVKNAELKIYNLLGKEVKKLII